MLLKKKALVDTLRTTLYVFFATEIDLFITAEGTATGLSSGK